MKILKYMMLIGLLATITAVSVQAKQVKTSHMYIFGFSASFKDSTLYITDIQDVQGAWYDKKTKFLMGRDNYSYQLKDYLTEKKSQPNRICMVFFATNKKKAEKKYLKLKKKYVDKGKDLYNIEYLSEADFKFEAIDMSPEE